MHCYRHPKEEATITCTRCERPICHRCMVAAPVGFRCPDCASTRSSPLFQVTPRQLALAGAAGLLVGMLGGFFLTQVPFFGFFVLFLGPIYGGLVGETVLRVSGRKRGPKMEALAAACVVVGYLTALAPELIRLGPGALIRPFELIAVALAVASALSRIRYFGG